MDENQSKRKNLKGTWNQAILTFLFPILLVLTVRWALIEPFVIPSGSMIPNLLVYDHVVVNKLSYGLHVPFSNKWLFQWGQPERGDIAVFKYPENPDVYYIKRLIGVPGDTITSVGGRITLNGQVLNLVQAEATESGFDYFTETIGDRTHLIRFFENRTAETVTFTVPENEYFFMGDNRDQSSDSRIWGAVKNEYLVGRASLIWLSCENTLPTMKFVCDPSQIRWNRIFKKLN